MRQSNVKKTKDMSALTSAKTEMEENSGHQQVYLPCNSIRSGTAYRPDLTSSESDIRLPAFLSHF